MKILLIASYPGSIISFRGKLIEALLDKGIEVHVAAPDFDAHQETYISLKNMGVNVHKINLQRTGINPFTDIITILSLIALMVKIKNNYVLSYTVKPVIYGSIAAFVARVPHRFALITGLGYAFTNATKDIKRSRMQTCLHWMYRVSLAKVGVVFFQNPDDEEHFQKSKLINKQTKTVILNGSGVDIQEYCKTPITSSIHFLLIARLLGDKGVREYAASAKRIRRKYPNVICSLAGWIDKNPDAIQQKELDEWISAGDINYLGFLNDVKPAIKNASIYVLPSYREGTPRTVLEAMAMGRPIITTDVPGCRETTIDHVNGFLVQPMSVDELTLAMERFVLDPGLVTKMGLCSREIAVKKYDVRNVNQKMIKEMGICD